MNIYCSFEEKKKEDAKERQARSSEATRVRAIGRHFCAARVYDDNNMAAAQTNYKEKVALIGSGNWGSAIARIVGANVKENVNSDVDPEVRMWVFEEEVGNPPRKLTEIINEQHENVKYLPGFPLPENVVAGSRSRKGRRGCHRVDFRF